MNRIYESTFTGFTLENKECKERREVGNRETWVLYRGGRRHKESHLCVIGTNVEEKENNEGVGRVVVQDCSKDENNNDNNKSTISHKIINHLVLFPENKRIPSDPFD